jgi:hypothetical protein
MSGTYLLQYIPPSFVSQPIRLQRFFFPHLSGSVAFRDISQQRISTWRLQRGASSSSHVITGLPSSTTKEGFPQAYFCSRRRCSMLVFCPAVTPSTNSNDSSRPFPFPPYILPGFSLFLSPPPIHEQSERCVRNTSLPAISIALSANKNDSRWETTYLGPLPLGEGGRFPPFVDFLRRNIIYFLFQRSQESRRRNKSRIMCGH